MSVKAIFSQGSNLRTIKTKQTQDYLSQCSSSDLESINIGQMIMESLNTLIAVYIPFCSENTVLYMDVHCNPLLTLYNLLQKLYATLRGTAPQVQEPVRKERIAHTL